ncbi:MAG: hypothetical protein SangKO_008590 [Sandaracinaceae bacterium]
MRQKLLSLCLVVATLSPCLAEAQAVVRRVPNPGDPDLVDYRIFFRARGELLHNLDLDRGPTPSGDPLFPVPQADPLGQLLTHADMRLRTDLAFNVPDSTVSVHARIDVLDNLSFGSLPVGPPADSRRQRSPGSAFVLKRAWAQVITPLGLIAAGRIGSHWGLGMQSNGGDCPTCDTDDAADRVFFATPLLGHIWTFAFDLTAIGPNVPRADGVRFLDVDPTDDTRTLTFALLNVTSDISLRRRTRAGLTTLEYGAFVSYRWQDNDWSPSYLPVPDDYTLSRSQIVSRGYEAVAGDAYLRLHGPWGRIGAEGAIIGGRFEEASLIPGVFLRDPVDSLAWGFAFESRFHVAPDVLDLGLDFGAASGDPAPGFGAFPSATRGPGQPGDLDGAQVVAPFDMRADNFRFHPNYRVDRILFREIIGTITDAAYVRAHAGLTVLDHPSGRLKLSLAGVLSLALESSSTPGGDNLLGVELDPTLSYENDDGWSIVAAYAVLFPFAGLDNVQAGLSAQPAQLLRMSLWVTL